MIMLKRRIRSKTDERGVALVTVLFVGAALTAVVSMASYSTIREFQAGGDDRRGTQALSVAEAGVDRMLQYLRSGSVTWGVIRNAGCTVEGTTYPPLTLKDTAGGNLASGSWFTVDLQVFDPNATGQQRFAPTACPTSQNDPRGSVRSRRHFVITSTGNSPAAKRVVRQVVQVDVLGLPVGLYANEFDVKGQPVFENISVITPNPVSGRSFVAMKGTDPFYTVNDFWPNWWTSSPVPQKPAAIHSLSTLYTQNNLLRGEEHSPGQPLNCTANNSLRGGPGSEYQSQWDMSGTGGDIPSGSKCFATQTFGPPPTSKFDEAVYRHVAKRTALTEQDYQTLKIAAQERGLYCRIGATTTCTRAGQSWSVSLTNTISSLPSGLEDNFVAYFEYETQSVANLVKWGVSYGRCQEPPPANTPNRSVTFVVRNGSINFSTTTTSVVRGAAFVPEGTVSESGSNTFVGTVIAQRIDARSASSRFMLDECWVKNIPGPFFQITPFHFSEVDR